MPTVKLRVVMGWSGVVKVLGKKRVSGIACRFKPANYGIGLTEAVNCRFLFTMSHLQADIHDGLERITRVLDAPLAPFHRQHQAACRAPKPEEEGSRDLSSQHLFRLGAPHAKTADNARRGALVVEPHHPQQGLGPADTR